MEGQIQEQILRMQGGHRTPHKNRGLGTAQERSCGQTNSPPRVEGTPVEFHRGLKGLRRLPHGVVDPAQDPCLQVLRKTVKGGGDHPVPQVPKNIPAPGQIPGAYKEIQIYGGTKGYILPELIRKHRPLQGQNGHPSLPELLNQIQKLLGLAKCPELIFNRKGAKQRLQWGKF